MADGDLDKLVRYAAQKAAAYLELPPDQRKALRRDRSLRKESWSSRWFGMLPYALGQWFRSLRH